MRCVNITSWPAAEISAGEAFCCSLSDDTVSAISSRSDDWRLMVRSAWPTWVRIFCCAITVLAFFSARSTSGSSGVERFLHARPARPRGAARRRVLQAAHGAGQHVGALPHLGEGLRRCRPAPATPTWPAAATASAPGRWRPPAAEPWSAAFSDDDRHATSAEQAQQHQAAEDALLLGQRPVADQRQAAARCGRVGVAGAARSAKSAISDGAASVMIDESHLRRLLHRRRRRARRAARSGSARSVASRRPGASSNAILLAALSMSGALSLRPSP